MTRRNAAYAGAVVAASLLLLLVLRNAISGATELYASTVPETPYFVLDHAFLLYALVPVVTVAASVVLLAPGVFLVLATGQADGAGDLILKGFGVSLALLFGLSSSFHMLSSTAISPTQFIVLLALLLAATWSLLAARVASRSTLPWPLSDRGQWLRLGTALAIPAVAVVCMLPIILWQDLNGDGVEALYIGRSLAEYIMPRFPTTRGVVGLDEGMLLQSVPVYWFVMLFGPVAAAARLPVLLYLGVLFAALVALIEWRSNRRMTPTELLALVLGLAVFAVTIAYNTAYESYGGDVASPGGLDILTVVSMLGALYFLWRRSVGWFFLFVLLGYFARPTQLVIVVLGGVAVAALGDAPKRKPLYMVAGAVALWFVLGWVMEATYLADVSHAASVPLNRLRFITLTDVSRLLLVIVPCGIVPILGMLAVRLQDSFARVLALVCLGYLVAFYLPSFIALHFYIPAMILPLTVFWRVVLRGRSRPWLAWTTAIVAALSLIASLPRDFTLNRYMRDIADATSYDLGDYYGNADAQRDAVAGVPLLLALFRAGWDIDDPATELRGSPLAIIHYAQQHPARPGEANYIVQPAAKPAPAGATLVSSDENGAVYVMDVDRWHRDRYGSFRVDWKSRLYDLSRETQHPYVGRRTGNYTVDLRKLPGMWRFF